MVDQGKALIAGYWDRSEDVYGEKLPVVVFGDHTRVFKYVDFPFAVGADGTRVLEPDTRRCDPYFLYCAALTLKISSRGYNRHFAQLREVYLPLPPLSEQRAIAHILHAVQRAKEATDKVIEATRELKKSLMHYLFTYGPVPVDAAERVPLKETEIGHVPEHWDVRPLKELAQIRYGLGQPPKRDDAGMPMVRATNIKRGKILREGVMFVSRREVPASRNPYLKQGDIIVVRSGVYTGDVALVTKEWEGAVAGYDLIVTPGSSLDSRFCSEYLLGEQARRYFRSQRDRSAQSHLNSRQLGNVCIPVPPLHEQRQVADILEVVDRKIEAEIAKGQVLSELFKALLHNLMTGRMRVTDLPVKEHGPGR